MPRTDRSTPLYVRLWLPLMIVLTSGSWAAAQSGGPGSTASLRKPSTTATASSSRSQTPRDASSANEAAARRSVGMTLEALRANPLIAPYPIMVSWQGNKVTLSGKVGTRVVYDLVVRTMIDSGIPFRESLVIDTAEAHRVAQAATMNAANNGNLVGQADSNLPYIYPPPLFGRVDDPFFGLEPPALSFPSYWQGSRPSDGGIAVSPSAVSSTSRVPAASQATVPSNPAGDAPVLGKARIWMDAYGRVFLRGVVANEQIKAAIEQEARSVPGVAEVINELTVENAATTPDAEGGAPASAPPPPPEPHPPADAVKLDAKDPKATIAAPRSLTDRVVDAPRSQPTLAEKPVKLSTSGDVVTLSGRVASAYEAMLAFRTAQQTPGVREVIDELEFPMPDEDSENPLLLKGEREDVLPYLEAHIRRNLGDLAHLDRVTLSGKVIEIRGTVGRAADTKRLTAILRSIPILRGFEIEPTFRTN